MTTMIWWILHNCCPLLTLHSTKSLSPSPLPIISGSKMAPWDSFCCCYWSLPRPSIASSWVCHCEHCNRHCQVHRVWHHVPARWSNGRATAAPHRHLCQSCPGSGQDWRPEVVKAVSLATKEPQREGAAQQVSWQVTACQGQRQCQSDAAAAATVVPGPPPGVAAAVVSCIRVL